jgi:hypothetical protein
MKEATLPEQNSDHTATAAAPESRDAIRRRILGKNPSPQLIANAKRVLTVLAITDAAGKPVQGEPAKGAFVIELTRKGDGRGRQELLDLCHALWPEATFSYKA